MKQISAAFVVVRLFAIFLLIDALSFLPSMFGMFEIASEEKNVEGFYYASLMSGEVVYAVTCTIIGLFILINTNLVVTSLLPGKKDEKISADLLSTGITLFGLYLVLMNVKVFAMLYYITDMRQDSNYPYDTAVAQALPVVVGIILLVFRKKIADKLR